jgi:hypothetical protein
MTIRTFCLGAFSGFLLTGCYVSLSPLPLGEITLASVEQVAACIDWGHQATHCTMLGDACAACVATHCALQCMPGPTEFPITREEAETYVPYWSCVGAGQSHCWPSSNLYGVELHTLNPELLIGAIQAGLLTVELAATCLRLLTDYILEGVEASGMDTTTKICVAAGAAGAGAALFTAGCKVTVVGGANCWNPAGWAAIGAGTVLVIGGGVLLLWPSDPAEPATMCNGTPAADPNETPSTTPMCLTMF